MPSTETDKYIILKGNIFPVEKANKLWRKGYRLKAAITWDGYPSEFIFESLYNEDNVFEEVIY
jgi:hypothetical protein